MNIIRFHSLERDAWIKVISDYSNSIVDAQQGDDNDFGLLFDEGLQVEDIQSIHLVALACLIELFDRKGYVVSIYDIEKGVGKFLYDTLQFKSYWAGGENFVPAKDDSIFNLWRIVDKEKEPYSQMVHDYLQNNFFKNKDLSAVKESLLEVYYNIFNHAQSDGNAFSLIKFDKETEKLYIAVCDFGIGIAATVRNFDPQIPSDGKALEKAMENGFTIGSETYNGGKGLGNIFGACFDEDVLRIVSNNGLMHAQKGRIQVHEHEYNFKGTLIYYELSLSHFDDKEIIDNFDLY